MLHIDRQMQGDDSYSTVPSDPASAQVALEDLLISCFGESEALQAKRMQRSTVLKALNVSGNLSVLAV